MSRFALVFWSLIGACGLVAIVGGIVDNARLASIAAAHAKQLAPKPSSAPPVLPSRGAAATFGSDWDVVVDRSPSPNADGSARLAIVVGPTGANAALDAAFARATLPLALVIDTSAADAPGIAALARSQGKPFYLQVADAPSPSTIGGLTRRFDGAAGFASANATGMATALAGTGLVYFDERGDANPAPFAKAGTPLIRRDLTVDDRDAPGYVGFMLQRAIVLGGARGRAVAWMHPRAASLQALRAFGKAHAADVVGFSP